MFSLVSGFTYSSTDNLSVDEEALQVHSSKADYYDCVLLSGKQHI